MVTETIQGAFRTLGIVGFVVVLGTVGAGTDVASGQNGGNSAGPTQIGSCTVIDEPGRYVLTEDIEDADTDVCIDIRSSDVHFDGDGHTVDGALNESALNESGTGPFPDVTNVSVGVGIGVPGSISNVTVSSVTVSDSIFGVYATNVTDARIDGVTASNNAFGITLSNSNDSVVIHSTASDNVAIGILADSLGGRITHNNTIADSLADGNVEG